MRYSNYYTSSGLFHVSLPLLMGTRMDVLLFGGDKQQLATLWEDVEKDLWRMEKMLNRFDTESEVSMVNDNAQFSAVQLSNELWNIMLECRRYYEWTDGYFDITKSDFGKIIFMNDSQSILFDKYGMMLDFGGYAKGYALKWMHKRFKDVGIKRALVNFGNSSVLAMGAHPYGDCWPIAIEDPLDGTLLKTINLCDVSMSVSGNTLIRQQHIMNPKTSEYVTGDRMVAVIAGDPVVAEAMTTAWLATGEENLPDWKEMFNFNNTYSIK